MGYYFYYPLENKIFVSRNAEFVKNSFMVQEVSGSHGILEMSRSGKRLELIQEEDTQPSENNSEAHNEVAPIEFEPQNKSAKQSTTAMSSMEAEYIVAAEASMEAVWIRKIIAGLRCVMPSNKMPMEMLCDNEPALAIASDPKISKGARHLQRKYHYIREVIQEGEIVLKKVHTDDNVADLFTKPMLFNKHFEHAMAIGIVPASSLM
nr:hypothetical protein [Tanacetum cinerariifolium]